MRRKTTRVSAFTNFRRLVYFSKKYQDETSEHDHQACTQDFCGGNYDEMELLKLKVGIGQ